MPKQWQMKPPRYWPLDRAEGKRPGLDRGASLGRRTTHDPHHYQPLAHSGHLRTRHGARPPLARRWRRARLPPAIGLDGPRRPHGHSPHHGPRLGACRVVDHRDEGITAISTAPRPFRPGRGKRKNPGAAVAAPGTKAKCYGGGALGGCQAATGPTCTLIPYAY